MRIPAYVRPSPRLVRISALGLFGLLLAGCGNDVTRFNEDPTGNPYRRGDVTNSTQQPGAAPVAQIESRPLAAPSNVNGTPVYGPAVYGSNGANGTYNNPHCLLYTSPSPRDS